jgi:hypothetical protein
VTVEPDAEAGNEGDGHEEVEDGEGVFEVFDVGAEGGADLAALGPHGELLLLEFLDGLGDRGAGDEAVALGLLALELGELGLDLGEAGFEGGEPRPPCGGRR